MSNEARTQDGGRRIGAIVQARMSSRRLPGKSLRSLCGKPMLQYVLESLAHVAQLDETIVATSTDPSDDPIVDSAIDSARVAFAGLSKTWPNDSCGPPRHGDFLRSSE
jgi:spore coat polysaccharide biosynthesis protein SpsF (cytidylyltransferase family)